MTQIFKHQIIFVGFIANLVNRPIEVRVRKSASEKVRPKKSYFSSACEYEKVPCLKKCFCY
jgi:hypothetical protein